MICCSFVIVKGTYNPKSFRLEFHDVFFDLFRFSLALSESLGKLLDFTLEVVIRGLSNSYYNGVVVLIRLANSTFALFGGKIASKTFYFFNTGYIFEETGLLTTTESLACACF